MGDLAAKDVADRNTDLADGVVENLAVAVDLADGAARVLSVALVVAGGSGCSKLAISSW